MMTLNISHTSQKTFVFVKTTSRRREEDFSVAIARLPRRRKDEKIPDILKLVP